ncbi:MAG: hypothetical protein RLZZ361_1138 [Cyanobacteriota bacterium]|jgi:hypothetical protein
MKLVKKFLFISLFLLNLGSCTNQFAYLPNNWQQITSSKDKTKTVYIDKNRVTRDGKKIRVWTKVLFGEVEAVKYSGTKPGQVSGSMMVKRIDSSIEYDCQSKTALLISYQLYDNEDKLIDSKWIKGDTEYARPGTIHGDVLKFICKNENKLRIH